MRVSAAVEKVGEPALGGHHAVTFHGGDAVRVLIVREHELAARVRCVIGGKRRPVSGSGRCDTQSHLRSALNVRTMPYRSSARLDRFGADAGGELENPCPVEPIEPGRPRRTWFGMNPAARDVRNLL